MDIVTIIEDFIKDNNLKSILIDGPWGSGKTTIINDFIKKNAKKNKIEYVSLFGINSIDEINTKLYFSNKTNKNVNKIGTIVSRAIGVVPIEGYNIGDALDFVLGELKNGYKIKNTIIIFDDFERIKNVDYVELMGYFNNLNLQFCKIICIVSSENIDDAKIIEFNKFKEKVFDRVYKIDCVNNEVFKNIFDDLNIDSIDRKFYLFNNNIRLAKKTKGLYLEIINHIKENKIRLKDSDNYIIFINCIYAIISMFGSYIVNGCNDANINKASQYNDYLIDQKFCSIRDKEIINNLKSMISNDIYSKDMQIIGFLDLLNSILKILYYKDYTALDIFFNRQEDNKVKNILKKQFFFLSDSEKKKYYNYFIRVLNGKRELTNEEITTCLTDIYAYSDFNLTNNVLEKFIRYIIRNRDESVLNDPYTLIHFITEKGTSGSRNGKEFVSNFKMIYDMECEKQDEEVFDSITKKNNYTELSAYLQNIHESKKWLNNKLKNNDYYFPNITKSIDYEMWSYCHAIANYCKNSELDSDFIQKLRLLIKNNMDNNSLKDRIVTLIKIVSNGKINTIDELMNSN